MSPFEILVVSLILTLAIALPFVYARLVTGGRKINRRPLPPIDLINSALARAAETGQPIHVSPGSGSLDGSTINPETLAGLVLAQRITDIAARRGAGISASSGDPIAHLALRGTVRRAYRDAGYSEDYRPELIQTLAANDPIAFSVGLSNRVTSEPMEASITVGSFEQGYLLFAEPGRANNILQIAGTTDQQALTAALLTANGTLLGEEIYAAEAYIAPTPLGFARILTHDVLRSVIIGIIIFGIILVSLGQLAILPQDFPLLPR